MAIRSKEAAAKIKEESGGKLDITFYPSSVLGQDTAMMSQAIAGALEIYGMSLDMLAQKSPSAAIFGVGFAFPDYDIAWEAMDGDLGNYCRETRRKGRPPLRGQGFDHGFRQITMKSKPINTPDDLKGVKIRLPVAPLFISLFKALGASPTADQFRRGLQCAADRAGRRPGKPADPDRHRQALRGAEILQHDQPHLGRAARHVQQPRRGSGCPLICRR